MFDIGWTEMLVIAVVMIVVVGPKELPGMLRTFGKTTAKLRVMAGDFRKQFDEALKEAELDDIKKVADDVRALNPKNEIKKALSPMEKAAQDVRAGLDAAMKPTSAKPQPSPEVASATADAKAVEPAKAGPTAMPGEGPGEGAPVVAKPAANGAAAPVKAATKAKPAAKPATSKPATAQPATAKKAPSKPAASNPKTATKTKTGGAAS